MRGTANEMASATLVTSETLSDSTARSAVWNLCANLKTAQTPIVVAKRLTQTLSTTQSTVLVPISLGMLAQELKNNENLINFDDKPSFLGWRITLILSGTGPTRISWLGLPSKVTNAEGTGTGEDVKGTEFGTRMLSLMSSVLYNADTGAYDPHLLAVKKSELETILPTEMNSTSLTSVNTSQIATTGISDSTGLEAILTPVRIAYDAQELMMIQLDGSIEMLFTPETTITPTGGDSDKADLSVIFPYDFYGFLSNLLTITETTKDTSGDILDYVFGYVLIDALDVESLVNPSVDAILQVSLVKDRAFREGVDIS